MIFSIVLVGEKLLADPETTIRHQKFDADENDPFILVVVTPLMKRVHEKVSLLILYFEDPS